MIIAEEMKAVYNYLKINDYKQQTDDYIYFSPNEFVCQSYRTLLAKKHIEFPYYIVIDSEDYDEKFYKSILNLGINRKDFKYRSKYGPRGLSQYNLYNSSTTKNHNIISKIIGFDPTDFKPRSRITKKSYKVMHVSTFNEYFIAFRDKSDCVLFNMRYNDKILACGDIHKILKMVKENDSTN